MAEAHDSAARPNNDEQAASEEAQDKPKSYVTILDQEIESGLEELERETRGLIFSGASAGLDIGFSILLLGVVVTFAEGVLSEPLLKVLEGLAYSVGFVFVIFGRSELFTEHTTLAVLPVLDGQASVPRLLRLWGIVFAANLAGGAAFAAMLAAVGPALGSVDALALGALVSDLVHHRWWVIGGSAILAGWMMGLLTWLVAAARETISQVFFVVLVTFSIGFAGLHHCIVGSVEVLTVLFAGVGAQVGVDWGSYGHFLLWATLGNMIGGGIFVALVKYAHATATRRQRVGPLERKLD